MLLTNSKFKFKYIKINKSINKMLNINLIVIKSNNFIIYISLFININIIILRDRDIKLINNKILYNTKLLIRILLLSINISINLSLFLN